MRRPCLLAVLAALGLAACGGSSSPSSSSGSSSSSAAPGSTSPSTTATSASSPGTGTTTSAAAGTSATTSSSSAAAKAPATNVRLAARFTIHAGDTLSPPLVAAPKHTEVVLTVVAGDGKPHRLVIQTPHRYSASVAPGHSAKLTLKGVPNGSYSVDVDGSKRGELIIGASPGP
ncbi:MAG TPA: hypothetical protein VGL51_01005 [Solirubrobacteraceae bacterium]|jgi:hypothetical protein